MAEEGSHVVHHARARRCPSSQFFSERRNRVAVLRRALFVINAGALQAFAEAKPDLVVSRASTGEAGYSHALLRSGG